MQVSRWGDSLAVRLPKDLVERLGLAAGDALTVVAVDDCRVTLARDTRRADALALTGARKVRLPEDDRFDRDAAHARRMDTPGAEPRRWIEQPAVSNFCRGFHPSRLSMVTG
jgi:antitoxin MazE